MKFSHFSFSVILQDIDMKFGVLICIDIIQKNFHFCILSCILSGVMPLWNLLGPVGDMYCFSNTYSMLVYCENMTSFLNYVTATLRALFEWRGSYIDNSLIELDSSVIELESSGIELESSGIEFESFAMQLERSLIHLRIILIKELSTSIGEGHYSLLHRRLFWILPRCVLIQTYFIHFIIISMQIHFNNRNCWKIVVLKA